MSEPGRLIAAGRDCDIFEYTPTTVLRRARDGRSLEPEGRVMAWLLDHGYPAPRVHDVVDGGLVLERLDGPTMLDDLGSHPWRLRAHARLLADLHRRLHEIDAPEGLPPSPFEGDRVLHLDLHPANVMLTSPGPMVIGWTNASLGRPAADVALAWLIVATSEIPGSRLVRAVGAIGRRQFVTTFVAAAGRDEARAALVDVAAYRRRDRNVRPSEHDAIERFIGSTLGR